jgi:cytoskeletal protein CcmA (bactofilin family)
MVPKRSLGGDVFVKESTGEKPNPWTSAALPASPSTSTSVSGRLSGLISDHIDKPGSSDADRSREDHQRADDDKEFLGSANLGPSEESRQIAEQSELHALLGPGTTFEGTLSFAGRIRIDGEFSGQILGGQVLVIGEGARVRGELQARHVIVLGGIVEANISASSSIELYRPAQVVGDLRSPQIYMDKGIQFQGTCDMTQNS